MSNLNEKLKQISDLENGEGIQDILDSAYKILGNPIAMFDTEYRLQAYTAGIITDDPFWNEIVTYGFFSYESQVFFMEEGFIDEVANSKSVAFLTSSRLKYNRMSGKLYNDNIHVSNLIFTACNKPFDDDDLILFEAVCKIISNEITKSEYYRTYGKMYRETYIRKLIDGEIIDKALYAAHVAVVYDGFETNMRIVVADIGRHNNGDYSKLAYFKDLFRKTQDNFEYAIYSNYLLIIINAYTKEFDPKRDLEKLYELCQQNNIYAGVSSSFDNLYELKKYYLEALNALNYELNNNDKEQFFSYDKLKEL